MDTYQKNTAMRMLPYGVHVLTVQAEEDHAVGAVVSWVTQASLSPLLEVADAGLKTEISSRPDAVGLVLGDHGGDAFCGG